MKKVMLTFTLCMSALGYVSAQTTSMVEYVIPAGKLNEGANIVDVPDGRGTISLVKSGNTFSNVIYTDAAGNTVPTAVVRIPDISEYPVLDISNGSEVHSIGILLPAPQYIGILLPAPQYIALLLPAVQTIRETARR